MNPKLKPGKTIDFFPLPDDQRRRTGNPLVGGGDFAAAFKDNDDVAKLAGVPRRARGREDLGLDRRDRLAEQGGDRERLPERPRAEGGRAGRERARSFLFDGSDLLPGALGDDWGRCLQNVHAEPGQAWTAQLADFQSRRPSEFSRLAKVGTRALSTVTVSPGN